MSDASEHAEGILRAVLRARTILGHPIEEDARLAVPDLSPWENAGDVDQWLAAQQGHILSVVRSVIAEDHVELAALLLSHVWAIVPAHTEQTQ